MHLTLSSAALPGATVGELLEACARRGLAGIELDACAGLPDAAVVTELAAALAGTGIDVAGVLVDATADAAQVAGLARRLDAPAIVMGDDVAACIACSERITQEGGRALVLVSGPASAWAAHVGDESPLAWQVDGTSQDPGGDAKLLLARAGGLHYVRLVGGGPEAVMQEGRGIGAVMTRLALAGYVAPLVLAPSSPRYRVAWGTWLGRRRGWGCGSSSAGRTLPIEQIAHAGDAA